MLFIRMFLDFVRTLMAHHPVHTLYAVYAFLSHFGTLSDVQAAEFASFLQDYAYGEQQYADCANSKRQK